MAFVLMFKYVKRKRGFRSSWIEDESKPVERSAKAYERWVGNSLT